MSPIVLKTYEKYGHIMKNFIVRVHETDKNRGFCFVVFERYDQAEAAMKQME